MQIVFAHQNHPGQFGVFADYLARNGWDVTFFTAKQDAQPIGDYRLRLMKPHREPTPGTHRFALPLERAAINGQAFANAAIQASREGLAPDVVVAHSGWGSGTFAKAVWPDCKFVPFAEWFYRWPPVDSTQDDLASDDRPPEDGRAMALGRNAPMLLDLTQADLVLCPTAFQAAQFPEPLRRRMVVQHDGVDTDALAPNPGARAMVDGQPLPEDAEVVTYATRGLEPHRGFPEFMRALARLQAQRPRLHAIIGGQDRVAYGKQLPDGESWKQRMLDELDLDLGRVHFVGLQSRRDFTHMLQATDLHVYLTVPFVLSWSLIEAMSIACPIVASDVAPVREALTDGRDALLVDHGEVDRLAEAMKRMLDDRGLATRLGQAARNQALRCYAANWIYPARAHQLRSLVQGQSFD